MKIKDAVLSFSFANLCLLSVWSTLLRASHPSESFFQAAPNGIGLLFSTLTASLLLGLSFWVTLAFLRSFNSRFLWRVSEAMFLLLLVVPVGTLMREALLSESALARHAAAAIGLAIKLTFVTAAAAVFLSPAKLILRAGKSFVFLMAPLFLVSLASLVKFRMEVSPAQTNQAELRKLSSTLRQRSQQIRLAVLIFDEFDQHLAFEDRPSSLRLPELDRLREQSAFASGAYPAGSDTVEAIPAMTTGKLLRKVTALGPSHLKLTFSGSQSELWGEQSTVFSALKEEGFRMGLAGWHLPYCRVFSNAMLQCHWESNVTGPVLSLQEEYLRDRGLLGAAIVFKKLNTLFMLESYLGIAPPLSILPEEVALARRRQLESYRAIFDKALQMVADPKLEFIFVHWPIPHPLGLYDRQKEEMSLSTKANYLDNLALVDLTVGRLRHTLEVADLWDSTVFLITSDHPLRRYIWSQPPWYDETALINGGVEHRRVPFLLKLRGQKAGALYDGSFSLVLLYDLILALMKEQILTADEFRIWMDLNRTRFPLDFRKGSLGN